MKPLMNMFLLHCSRWYDIHLSFPPPVLRSLAPAKNRLLKLQKLSLDVQWEESLNIFEQVPQLCCFQLTPRLVPSMVKVPWNQLKYLYSGLRQVDHCLELLCTTLNLEKWVVQPYLPLSPHLQSPIQYLRFRSMVIDGDLAYLFDCPILTRSPLIL